MLLIVFGFIFLVMIGFFVVGVCWIIVCFGIEGRVVVVFCLNVDVFCCGIDVGFVVVVFFFIVFLVCLGCCIVLILVWVLLLDFDVFVLFEG